jgi:hypothetical protein
MKRTVFLLILFFMIFLISCKKSDIIITTSLNTEYYPLKIGNYIIYDVDSTSFNVHVSKHNYELKELVADTFYDQEKRLNYRIERYQRFVNSDPWQMRQVWTAIPSEKYIIINEQNTNFVRLNFLVNINQSWNLNAYNNREAENVSYSDFNKLFKMGTEFVDSSVTVIEKADTLNLVLNEYQKRVYGLHTGLLYLYRDSLKLEFNPQRKGDTIGGYILKLMIKEHNY